jgi:hypothetical protein
VSRKKKRKSAAAAQAKPAPAKIELPEEERSSVAITVAWMLATLACLMSETVWLIGALWIRMSAEDPSRHPLAIIPDMMRLIAVCTGILALILMPFVLRVRRTPPPRAITAFSIIIATLPLVAMIARLAFGS